jgi:hypothetical protein
VSILQILRDMIQQKTERIFKLVQFLVKINREYDCDTWLSLFFIKKR